jgi:uncharacterized OsmC-like protein
MSMIERRVDDANSTMEEGQRPVGNHPLEALESSIGGCRAAKKGTTMVRSRSELS